ncbi:MAG: flagellar biosynthesis protein FlhA [Thermodesulfobacteriota bacterium]
MAERAGILGLNLRNLAKQGDVLLAAGVVLILIIMLIPLPPLFLDVMLTFSISFSLVVLMTTMFADSPLEFSVFPSVILIATMLRLGLNVATTRRILLYGDQGPAAAGEVIQAFGQFVVGGNFIIGIIIFLILFALNKLVIAKGMERIGEVTARFTLDAMPGKQMAIDADLNAGFIDEQQARQMRDEIRREADFYGAMDGAGKFVQGDINAGIMITGINIVGGFLIGILQQGMGWMEAIQTYTILTIGDGLVSIIPSLIVASSAGLMVSRAAGKTKMGEEFLGQLTHHARALRLVAGVLFLLAMVPGMPKFAFVLLAGILLGLSFLAQQQMVQKEQEEAAQQEEESKPLDSPEEVKSLLQVDPLALEVGYGLIPLVDEEQDGNLLARIRSIRRQLALEMGVVIPSMHVRDNLNLKPGQYNVLIKGNPVASTEIMTDHYLAMDPGGAKKKLEGIKTREPAFNLPAMWIPKSQKEEAMLAGYTVVDPASVVATHLTEVLKRNLHEFLGRQETQDLLDNLAKRSPKAVEELVPNTMNLGALQKVLQNLVQEGVSIRDLLSIVESLADLGQNIKDPDQLTELVRQRLSRTVVRPYLTQENVLQVLVLDSKIERQIQQSLRQSESGTYLALEPAQAQKIIQAINQSFEKVSVNDGQPVLLTSPQIRGHLAQLVIRFIPMLPVISQAEIPADIKLESVATVRLQNEG